LNNHAKLVFEHFHDIFEKLDASESTGRNEFMKLNEEILNIIAGIASKGVPDYWTITALNMFYHMCRYKACGYQDFMVMPALSNMLDNTSLDADPRLFFAPFPAFSIEPPPDYGKVWNEMTGLHNLMCFYVSIDEVDDGTKEIRIMEVGKPNKNSQNELDDAFFYFRCNISPDQSIGESFDRDINKMTDDISLQCDDKDHVSIINKNIEDAKRNFAYCINVILYVNSSNADMKWRNCYPHNVEARLSNLNDESRKNKLRKINKAERKCILGVNVKNVCTPRDGTNKKWSLQNRVFVRGHYHGYWYGSGKDKVLRPKLIEPYWKGPDKADVIHKKFQVE